MEARNERLGTTQRSSTSNIDRVRRFTTETKEAFKTSEFWLIVAVIIGVLVSAAAIKGGDTEGTDEFIARNAWLYVTILAAAYAIGRGLAKSGSYEPYGVDPRDGEVRDNTAR